MSIDFVNDNSPAGTDFRKNLEECFRTLPLKNFGKKGYELRQYKRLRVGGYDVSVQASVTHACHPQTTVNDPHKYEAFEVAIFKKDTHELINPVQDSRFSKRAWTKHWEDDFGSYVPAKTVQGIIDDLKKK